MRTVLASICTLTAVPAWAHGTSAAHLHPHPEEVALVLLLACAAAVSAYRRRS